MPSRLRQSTPYPKNSELDFEVSTLHLHMFKEDNAARLQAVGCLTRIAPNQDSRLQTKALNSPPPMPPDGRSKLRSLLGSTGSLPDLCCLKGDDVHLARKKVAGSR